MVSKAEARELRLALKQEKFEAAREATLNKVLLTQVPKMVVDPARGPEPKLAPHLQRQQEQALQEPRSAFDGSRFDSAVTWCITRADTQDDWSWQEPRAWTDAEWEEVIHPKFQEFGQMTWAQVDTYSSDSGHKMHHSQELWEVHPEAQSRWLHLQLQEFDSLFRFRLGNKKRAWGYVVQAHFHLVWWERTHAIYVSKGK